MYPSQPIKISPGSLGHTTVFESTGLEKWRGEQTRSTLLEKKPDGRLPDQVYDAYKREFTNGVVNAGTKCNLRCFYCSQEFNPPNLVPDYREFLTVEEIKHFLSFVPNKNIVKIGSSDLVGAGEFFSHPQAFEIFQYLKDEDFIVNDISTNGIPITEDHVKLMDGWVKNIGLHLTGPGGTLHMPNEHSTSTIETFDLVDKYKIPYSVYIVPTRNDIEHNRIEEWIGSLQDRSLEEIRLLQPGYTKYTPEKIAKQMDISNEEIWYLIEKWQRKYPKIKIDYQRGKLHEASILNSLLNFMATYTQYTTIERPKTLFLIAKSVEDIFEDVLRVFTPIDNYKIHTVENITFGGNCEISGLLLVDDYVAAIEKVLATGYKPDFLVFPKISFEVYPVPGVDGWVDADLRGIPALDISEKFKIPMQWC